MDSHFRQWEMNQSQRQSDFCSSAFANFFSSSKAKPKAAKNSLTLTNIIHHNSPYFSPQRTHWFWYVSQSVNIIHRFDCVLHVALLRCCKLIRRFRCPMLTNLESNLFWLFTLTLDDRRPMGFQSWIKYFCLRYVLYTLLLRSTLSLTLCFFIRR